MEENNFIQNQDGLVQGSQSSNNPSVTYQNYTVQPQDQKINFDDLNKLIKIIKKREENYIQLLENFKKRHQNMIFTEIDFKLYNNIHEQEQERILEEIIILEKYNILKSDDIKIKRTFTRFITRICEINEFASQKLKYLGLYDNQQQYMLANFMENLHKHLIKTVLEVDTLLQFIMKHSYQKLNSELNKIYDSNKTEINQLLLNDKTFLESKQLQLDQTSQQINQTLNNCNNSGTNSNQSSISPNKNQILNHHRYSTDVQKSPYTCFYNNNMIDSNYSKFILDQYNKQKSLYYTTRDKIRSTSLTLEQKQLQQNNSNSKLQLTQQISNMPQSQQQQGFQQINGTQQGQRNSLQQEIQNNINSQKIYNLFYDKIYFKIYDILQLEKIVNKNGQLFHRFQKDISEAYYKESLQRNFEAKDTLNQYYDEIQIQIKINKQNLSTEIQKMQLQEKKQSENQTIQDEEEKQLKLINSQFMITNNTKRQPFSIQTHITIKFLQTLFVQQQQIIQQYHKDVLIYQQQQDLLQKQQILNALPGGEEKQGNKKKKHKKNKVSLPKIINTPKTNLISNNSIGYEEQIIIQNNNIFLNNTNNMMIRAGLSNSNTPYQDTGLTNQQNIFKANINAKKDNSASHYLTENLINFNNLMNLKVAQKLQQQIIQQKQQNANNMSINNSEQDSPEYKNIYSNLFSRKINSVEEDVRKTKLIRLKPIENNTAYNNLFQNKQTFNTSRCDNNQLQNNNINNSQIVQITNTNNSSNQNVNVSNYINGLNNFNNESLIEGNILRTEIIDNINYEKFSNEAKGIKSQHQDILNDNNKPNKSFSDNRLINFNCQQNPQQNRNGNSYSHYTNPSPTKNNNQQIDVSGANNQIYLDVNKKQQVRYRQVKKKKTYK